MNTNDVSRLIPPLSGDYAGYQSALADVLNFFFRSLPGKRREAIQRVAQAEAKSPIARLVAVLRECPTLHKLAQTVARDRRLPFKLRAGLQMLESCVGRLSTAEADAIVQRELGSEFQSVSLGDEGTVREGSVAVVLGFRRRNPRDGVPAEGVLKVLKPCIESRLEEDLSSWAALGAYFNERCRAHGLPVVDYEDTIATVGESLRHEVDLRGEQRNLADAVSLTEHVPGVRIPHLFPELCTSRRTAMERIDGRKATELADAPERLRRLIVHDLVEALIAQPVFSTAAKAMFHGDPHAGNLLVTSDAHLAIIDWSMVGFLRGCVRRGILADNS